MMHMTFYWGTKVTLLFSSWKTDSWSTYVPTIIACFLFSAFYQFMEDRRLRFKSLAATFSSQPLVPAAAPLLPKFGAPRVATAVLFGVNSAIGYLLMLAVMSFNGGVFLAVVLGLCVGYFLFRGANEGAVVVESACACA